MNEEKQDWSDLERLCDKEKSLLMKIMKETATTLKNKKTIKSMLDEVRREMDLLQTVQKIGSTQRVHKVALIIAKSINDKLNHAIRLHPEKLRVWEEYMKFVHKFSVFSQSKSLVLEQMLSLNKDNPVFYKFAANWEYNDSLYMTKVRHYITAGLKQHKKSKVLYWEGFRLELEYIKHLRKQEKVAECRPQPEGMEVDNISASKIKRPLKGAEDIYELAMREVKDVRFAAKFLALTENFDFCEELKKKILKDLSDNFSNDELSYDVLAKHSLKTVDPLKIKIKKCALVYKLGIKKLNTERMWKLYLDTMINLCRDNTKLRNAKRNALLEAFNKAHEKEKVCAEHYLKISTILSDEDKILILKKGTGRHPSNVDLWLSRLRFHLVRKDRKSSKMILDDATSKLKDGAVPLWKLYLQALQITDMPSVQKFFEDGINMQGPAISNALKPMFMEWLTLLHGITAARRNYDIYSRKQPYCLELHSKMIELETLQCYIDKVQVRKCHQNATEQFGSQSTKAWINYIEFEKNNREEELVKELYNRALHNLAEPLHSDFETEYRLLDLK